MEAQNNITFDKMALLLRLNQISSHPYKILYCESFTEITKDYLTDWLNSIRVSIYKYNSFIISDFISTKDITEFVQDGHLDKQNTVKYISDELTLHIPNTVIQCIYRSNLKNPLQCQTRNDIYRLWLDTCLFDVHLLYST